MFESVFKYPKLEEVATDILLIDFLEEEFCSFIIEACKGLDTWAPNKRDRRYFTQDIHFSTELPVLHDIIAEQLNTIVCDLVSSFWSVDSFSVSDLFAIRYSLDTQKNLPLHHDDSFITGSVKLNNDYSGAELLFPRQNFSNINVPVGSLLVFPGKITHPHMCKNLLTGEKYSLTIWTKEDV